MDMKLTRQRALKILSETGDLILREPEGTDDVYDRLYDAIWPESEMGPDDDLLEEMRIAHVITGAGAQTRMELTFEEVRGGQIKRWRVNTRHNGEGWTWAPRATPVNRPRHAGRTESSERELALAAR